MTDLCFRFICRREWVTLVADLSPEVEPRHWPLDLLPPERLLSWRFLAAVRVNPEMWITHC
jgi:hypothetical protein